MQKTQAIVLTEYGGPECLRISEIEVPAPARGEVSLRQTAIGLNFHDAYVRSGLYKTLALPGIPRHVEAAGRVIAEVGEGVTRFQGRRPG